jgi:hypothetical protein
MVEEPVEDLTKKVTVALSGRHVGRFHSATSPWTMSPDCCGSEADREYSDANLVVEPPLFRR